MSNDDEKIELGGGREVFYKGRGIEPLRMFVETGWSRLGDIQ